MAVHKVSVTNPEPRDNDFLGLDGSVEGTPRLQVQFHHYCLGPFVLPQEQNGLKKKGTNVITQLLV
jgi:hypothetical protein